MLGGGIRFSEDLRNLCQCGVGFALFRIQF